MNGGGKSDRSIVPKKPSNKGGHRRPSAERAEGRDLTKENLSRQNKFRTQYRRKGQGYGHP